MQAKTPNGVRTRGHQGVNDFFWRNHLKVARFLSQRFLVDRDFCHSPCQELRRAFRKIKRSHVLHPSSRHGNSRRRGRKNLNPKQRNRATVHTVQRQGIHPFCHIVRFLHTRLGPIRLRIFQSKRHFLVKVRKLFQNCLQLSASMSA